MEPRFPQPWSLARDLVDITKRVFSLERQFSAFKRVRILDDLDDTETLYDDTSTQPDGTTVAPQDGDVLTFSTTRDSEFGGLWVPASPSGGGWCSMKVEGTWTDGGGHGATALQWSVASGVGACTVASSGSHRGIVVADAGIYLVTLNARDVSAAMVRAYIASDSWSLDGDGDCLPNYAEHYGSDVMDGVTVSDHFALPAEGAVWVGFEGAGSDVYWELAVHWVAAADVVEGTCEG